MRDAGYEVRDMRCGMLEFVGARLGALAKGRDGCPQPSGGLAIRGGRMRACVPTFLFAVVLCCLLRLPLNAAERAQSWKPEAVPGAAQLNLAAVDRVVLPESPSAELEAAVADLRVLWPGCETRYAGCGVRDLINGSVPTPNLQRAVVSSNAAGLPKNSIVLQRSDSDWLLERLGSFSIQRERTRIYVTAATDEGLVNGVIALCRDLLGARWYWATDLGFEQVGSIPVKFPDQSWREAPDFVMRSMRLILMNLIDEIV